MADIKHPFQFFIELVSPPEIVIFPVQGMPCRSLETAFAMCFHVWPGIADLVNKAGLSLLGVDVCEAGFPIASPGDFESVKAIAQEVGNIERKKE